VQRLVGIAKLAAEGDLLAAKRTVEYFELPTRKLLNRTSERMPFDWTVNPYRGCEIGCKYCFARYTHEFMELRRVRDFEEKIYAKRFVAAAFAAELQKVSRKEPIAIGTVTDPYQPAERRFGVTRAILGVFAREAGRRISLTTKSDLVLRDVELLGMIARANVLHVNVTITTIDEKLARLLEPRAPRPELRLRTVSALAAAGIRTGVFANPVMPLITDAEEQLDALACAARAAGATHLSGGPLFLQPCSKQVFLPFLDRHFPELVPAYRRLFGNTAFLAGPYRERIEERTRQARARYGLAAAPVEYTPELWHTEPEQGSLFECAG
jgi:DNA repair photolyase